MENVKEKDGPVNKCPAHIFKDPVAVDLNPDARVLEQEREYLLEELEEDLMVIDIRRPMPHVLTLLMRGPMKHMFNHRTTMQLQRFLMLQSLSTYRGSFQTSWRYYETSW